MHNFQYLHYATNKTGTIHLVTMYSQGMWKHMVGDGRRQCNFTAKFNNTCRGRKRLTAKLWKCDERITSTKHQICCSTRYNQSISFSGVGAHMKTLAISTCKPPGSIQAIWNWPCHFQITWPQPQSTLSINSYVLSYSLNSQHAHCASHVTT